jgi:DNA-binding SARP family transcriptional activator
MIFVHTLGTALIDVGQHTVKPTSPRKFALLLYLVAERGRRIPRLLLQELIFPDQPERNGRHSLRELLYQLRQLGVALDTAPGGVKLRESQVSVDYDRFLFGDTLDPDLVQAASGGFLPGYTPTHSEAFSEWYEGYRARSISTLGRMFLKDIGRARNSNDWVATERSARACLALDPLNEEATLVLAEVLALSGAKARAVKLLDAYMGEVGRISPELRLPPKLLRGRIHQVPEAGHIRSGPRFVGRSDELVCLRNVLRSACRYEAHCVVVSGEPGIGKTRLLSEFRSIAELEGVRCESVLVQPHDISRPMGAFVDLVPALLRLPGALGCSPKSMDGLKRLVGDAGAPSSERKGPIELEVTARGLTAAIGDLCESISAEFPLALIIEDVHSLDEYSILTLSAIISSHQRSRVLVLVSTREPRPLLHTIRHSDRVHHLHLMPLPVEATDSLLADLLSPSTVPITPYARRQLADVANGNPLFAVLLAAHFLETGDSGSIPSTLVDSLTRRLDSLPRLALNVLATCIALGKHCTTDRLLRALEITPMVLLETIADLTDLGLLDGRNDRVAAAHPLIAEAVTRRVLPSVRGTVNFRVAEVFEHDARTLRSPALWWEAATRWHAADEAERAVGGFRECARHAMEIGRPGDAARMLDTALRLAIAPECRIATARELVLAADYSSDADLVFHGQQVLRAEQQSGAHDDLELAERRAFLRSAKVPEHLLEMTRECLRAPDASDEHRVEAATLALKCAEVFGTGQKMVEMIQQELSARDVASVETRTQLEFELLFRSAKEDRAGAAETALQLFEEIKQHSLIEAMTPALNCGIALFLAGRAQAAIDALEWVYRATVETHSLKLQMQAALVLGSVYDDIRDDRKWDMWLSRATDLALQNPELAQTFDLTIMRIMRAISAGDLVIAERLLDEADRTGTFDEGPARQRWGRGIRLLLRTSNESIGVDEEDFARTIFKDHVHSMHGYRDVEIAAAAAVLQFRHREEALSSVQSYLSNERTTLRPVTRILAELIQRLESQCSRPPMHQPSFALLNEPEPRSSIS